MRIIQYAIDASTGLVVSRVGSELAWPIMDYPNTSCHLEKIPLIAAAATWPLLKWTRKIDMWTKNLHRKFWGFKELK